LAVTDQSEASPTPEPEVVEITRYPNRRLYDRSQARYVTLQEIADVVRQGKTISVRDSKTGEDLTRLLLTQIILEQYPERMELFPVAVLHSMIRANSAVLDSLRDYFRQSLSYLDALQRSAPLNPFMAPLDWMRMFLPNLATPSGRGSPAPQPDAEALAHRVAELEQRLDQLTAVGNKASGKNPSRSKDQDHGKSKP
jgi:polyhydroxyalkanoate synthesis repressor PhaR